MFSILSGSDETGRHARFRISCFTAWGFESLLPHSLTARGNLLTTAKTPLVWHKRSLLNPSSLTDSVDCSWRGEF